MIKSLQNKCWRCTRTKIDKDHLHVSNLLQSGHQSHGLTGAWRTAKQEWTLFLEPAAKDFLVTSSVNSGDNLVSVGGSRGVQVDGGDLFGPKMPSLIVEANLVVDHVGATGNHGRFNVGEVSDLI